MDSYTFLLQTHSLLRWVVLFMAVIVTMKSLMGIFGNPKYGKIDNVFAASYVGFMHLQFLIGLVLYAFLSPITGAAFDDFGGAMKNPEMRFWAIEHITIMLLAIILAQIGRTRSKKASDPARKFKLQAIFFGISFILMLLGIPWNRF